ncbi:energy transducer TonB [Roseateles chitinivorans]|uniref:energy transducer TonB n=1 Tax=Roseateles chitinivorans TaxID=2917965 RepID=UPI003D66B88E
MEAGRMTRPGRLGLLVLAGALQFGVVAGASAQEVQQPLNVWFDVLFDENGQAKEVVPIDEASQSPAFWQQMTARLQKAKIPPRQEDGKNASFRTGVRLYLNVDKVKSTVAISSMQMVPIPTKIAYASYPKDAASNAGWEGEIKMICRVGTDGTCVQANVEMPAGMPESLRRYGRASMEQWRFQPQEVNGKPVEGEYVVQMRMKTRDDMPVDFRDPRKL